MEIKMQKYYVHVNPNGVVFWYSDENFTTLDRTGAPAIEGKTKQWFVNGKRHREDGPSIEWSSGSKTWYKNGKRHRTDGPAIEYAGGSKEWYLEGKLMTEHAHAILTAPTQEMTVAKIEAELGYKIKLIK